MSNEYPDEVVLPSQPIEVNVPGAEADSSPVDSQPIHAELPETDERTPDAYLGDELDDEYEGEPLKGDDNVALDDVDVDDDGDTPSTDTPWPEGHDEYGQEETGEE